MRLDWIEEFLAVAERRGRAWVISGGLRETQCLAACLLAPISRSDGWSI